MNEPSAVSSAARDLVGKDQRTRPIDLLMWVGGCFYTVSTFIKEAKRLGCCKRVPQLPKRVVIGKSRVYLAHDTSEEEEEDEEDAEPTERKWGRRRKRAKWRLRLRTKQRGKRRIFGYYVVRGIEAVRSKGFPTKNLLAKKVREVSRETARHRPMRGCGFEEPGALYLVSAENMDTFRKQPKKPPEETIRIIRPAVEIRLKRYRGIKYVFGDRIGKEPEQRWFK